jgi:queuine tRNA-ribosyltransferase
MKSEPPPDPSTFPAWAYEERDFFRFELIYQSKKSMARVGRIHTPHGVIDTPSYVAVATNGALKGLEFSDADAAGQQLVFCNSYHLMLQPGPDIIRDAGGLHKYIQRPNGPLITDSGGFQVFSLAYGSVHEELSSKGELKRTGAKKNRSNHSSPTLKNGESPVKCTEEGVLFRSYRDGRKILLTPESTVQAQKDYGADIIIPLDELPPYHIDRDRLVESVDLTHRWEARSLREHLKDVKQQAMYSVIHGGVDVELRTKSIDYLTSLPFDGYAIGGSLGKNSEELLQLLEWMMPLLNEGDWRRSKPRHLLGIADEESIRGAVTRGIDTMDSCYPTRLSRHGTMLTRHEGKIHLTSGAKHSRAYGVPIDPECSCPTCQKYDRAYLWHLLKAKEPLFIQLATIHNIQYMNDLMAQQRQDILDGKI